MHSNEFFIQPNFILKMRLGRKIELNDSSSFFYSADPLANKLFLVFFPRLVVISFFFNPLNTFDKSISLRTLTYLKSFFHFSRYPSSIVFLCKSLVSVFRFTQKNRKKKQNETPVSRNILTHRSKWVMQIEKLFRCYEKEEKLFSFDQTILLIVLYR